MRISKRGRRTIERGEAGIKRLRRAIDRGDCHPSWGGKRIARTQRVIDAKENRLMKKKMSKSGKKTKRRADKYSG